MGAGPEHWVQHGLAAQLQDTGRGVETEVIISRETYTEAMRAPLRDFVQQRTWVR